MSCSAPQRVTPEYFARLDDLSRAHDLPYYAHMLETRLQRVFGEECLGGRSLVRYTADLGLLSSRMNVIHAIWLDDADLDLIAESGASVAHNPISNLRLGSGVMRLREMLERQIPVCLGVDEAIADDAINMWSVMKTASMLHTLSDPDYDRWPAAREVLTAATVAGGHAMREPDLGSITEGALADMILVDLDALPFIPLNDLPRQLVHCELGQSVRLTMVNGRTVFEDGVLSSVDRRAIMNEAREVFGAKVAAMDEADRRMSDILPYYRKMYDISQEYPLSLQRKLDISPRRFVPEANQSG